MKKIFFFAVYSLFTFFIFAQDVETIRYWDPSQNRYITARVLLIGWEHSYITVSNSGTGSARLLTYSSTKLIKEIAIKYGQTSEWSEWELINTEPLPYADVNDLILRRNVLIEHYRMYPISGRQIGTNYLRIAVPPSNRGDPAWFDENNDLNMFFNSYMIVP